MRPEGEKPSFLFFSLHYRDNAVHLILRKLLDDVQHDMMNYQCRGLRYLPKPKADNANKRLDNS